MADTVATLSTALARAAGVFCKLDAAARLDTYSLAALIATAEAEPDLQPALNSFRKAYAAALSDGKAKQLADPIIRRWGAFIGSEYREPRLIIADMHEYFHNYDLPAQGTLTMDTEPNDGDTIEIGAITYRFKTTMAQAEDILTGDGLSAVKARLVGVMNNSGVSAGVDYYSGSTVPHPTVLANAFASDDSVFEARTNGTAGNSLASVITATGNNAFDAATLGTTQAGREELSVQSRAFTFASASAASTNTGTGTVRRLTVDKYGKALEGSLCADSVSVKCTKSANSGARRYYETFQIKGLAAGDVGRAEILGSGAGPTVVNPAVPNQTFIPNPSFDTVTPTSPSDGTTLTAISGWEIVSGTMLAAVGDEGAEIYRDTTNGGSPKGLRSEADFKIRSRARGFNSASAYDFAISVLRTNSCDGTLTFRIGQHSVTLDMTTLTNGDWYRLVMTVGANSWFDNFDEINSDVADGQPNGIRAIVQLDGNSAGECSIDDLSVTEFRFHDAIGYVVDGPGTDTGSGLVAFAKDDEYTFEDAETGAKIQKLMSRAYRLGLPHVSSSPTIAEPTIA